MIVLQTSIAMICLATLLVFSVLSSAGQGTTTEPSPVSTADPTVGPCSNGTVRLVDGCDLTEGTVELCVNGVWGTVCDDFWNTRDAEVVCGQLGFPRDGSRATNNAHFGQGTGPIWLDNTECVGDEQALLHCRANPIGENNCRGHSQDAGVMCLSACTCGNVRLAGGQMYYEGRVEICSNEQWRAVAVCDGSWDDLDAQVVCQQIGYISSGGTAVSDHPYGNGTAWSFLESVTCNGREASLMECNPAGTQECSGSIQTAGAICSVSKAEENFLSFGSEFGDNVTNQITDEFISLGPLSLETPVVFYLRQEYQLYVSKSGIISFREPTPTESTERPLSIPQLAPLWAKTTSQLTGSTLYSRVATDMPTLNRVKEILLEENAEMRNFEPSLAVIITVRRNTSEASQVVLSTNGRASFVSFLFNDGEGLRALRVQHLVSFHAGDQERKFLFPQSSTSLAHLYSTLRSFRIDEKSSTFIIALDISHSVPPMFHFSILSIQGDCIAPVASACSLNAYTFGCAASSVKCRCYQTYPQNLNLTEGPVFSMNTSCVPGSVPVNRGSELWSCQAVHFLCLISDNCPDDPTEINCTTNTNTDFFAFGGGVGDTTGSNVDESNVDEFSFGPLNFTVPLMYFDRNYTSIYISTNGLVSFGEQFSTPRPCDFSCTDTPVIAPLWADLNFGHINYRLSQDSSTLQRVARLVTSANPGLSDYQPMQAAIITWFDAQLAVLRDPRNETFQLIVSTDGHASFATILYADLQSVQTLVTSPSLSLVLRIGFDAGGENDSIAIGDVIRSTALQLEPANTYRIDGLCITSVLPGQVCNLQGSSETCSNLAAISCECERGFEFRGSICREIDRCGENSCGHNSQCIDDGMCVCDEGYTGDGFLCADIDECEFDACGSNGVCSNSPGNFSCDCMTGFTMTESGICEETASGLSLSSIYLISFLATLGPLTIFLLIALLLLLYCYKRQRKLKYSKSNELGKIGSNYFSIELGMKGVQSSFKLKVSKKLLVYACNIELGKTIGEGEFGIVYKAMLRQRLDKRFTEVVACKTLKGHFEQHRVTEMLKECAKMKDFNHPNILPLRGVCLDSGPAPYIIMPFMSKGSLLNYLKTNRESLIVDPDSDSLDRLIEVSKQLMDMCFQVGKGMEYLASKRLIHRDLATRNCMIDTGFVIKVADFGLSETLDLTKEYFRQNQKDVIKLPIKWLAPECISDGIFSEKTDVWAYGVTCWEVFSGGKTPYPGIHPLELPSHLERGFRLDKPINDACSNEMFHIVRSCWEQIAERRPCFSEVVTQLSNVLGRLANYFELGVKNMALMLAEENDILY